jgi:hypothetical protein
VRNLSPLVFFLILAVIALGVIMHTSMDQTLEPLVGASASSIVILADGGVAQISGSGTGESYSAGTYILFIVIAVVGVVYAFRMLFKHLGVHMIALMAVLAVAALGLIFDPDTPAQPEAREIESTVIDGRDAHSPSFFALEALRDEPDVGNAVAAFSAAAIGAYAVILLASLIILVMLPQISIRTKRTAMLLFAVAVAIVALGALFFDDIDKGYLYSSLSGNMYAIILVGSGLFVITAPLVHTKFSNISNVFIVSMGVLAFVAVYFLTEPNRISMEGTERSQVGEYRTQIITKVADPRPAPEIAFREPARVNVDGPGMPVYAQLAYCVFIIVLLHIFLFIAMEEYSFSAFWRYWHVVAFGALLWGSLFFAIGVPLWQIAMVIGIAMVSAPNVMHIIGTYRIKQRRDVSISQWSG